jgi:hypothetical protein
MRCPGDCGDSLQRASETRSVTDGMLLPGVGGSGFFEQLVFVAGNLVDDRLGDVVAFGSVTRLGFVVHVDLEPDPAFLARGAATDRSVMFVCYWTAVHMYLGLAVTESVTERAASSSSV